MNRPHANRVRLGGAMLAAAAAFALLALPGLASGHDHHHAPPADAGTIESFDGESGVLTIALTNGGTDSGLVTPRTHIQCGRDRGHGHGRGNGHGRGHGRRNRRGTEHSARCTTDELVAGTPVRVAELTLIDGNAYFKLVALPPKRPEGEPKGPEYTPAT